MEGLKYLKDAELEQLRAHMAGNVTNATNQAQLEYALTLLEKIGKEKNRRESGDVPNWLKSKI